MFGVNNQQLMYLATSLLKRPAVRFIVQNGQLLLVLWLTLSGLIWLGLMLTGAFMDPPSYRTHFILDEIAQLGTLEKVESALTLSAGYGVQLWGIWQHLKDIDRCYPSSGVAGWVSSSGVRLVFATQDNESVRYFAHLSGEAMTETDIRHMAQDQMLCLLDGQNPVVVERVPWFAAQGG